ncbi:MAG: phosphatase PAP2 family protein [Myxococcaceae bacterium]|nr:phosphatase PAP2 family protein [Myxococcaceae bacterium]
MGALRRILSWDQALFLRVARLQRPSLRSGMLLLTRIGDWWVWTLLASVLVFVPRFSGSRMLGLAIGFGALFAAAFTYTLKRISRRSRPDARIEGFRALAANPDAYSFPSGHTAAAVGVAVAVFCQDTGLGLVAAALASAIAISRVYLGAHFPLDVTAGACVGALAGWCAHLSLLGLGWV